MKEKCREGISGSLHFPHLREDISKETRNESQLFGGEGTADLEEELQLCPVLCLFGRHLKPNCRISANNQISKSASWQMMEPQRVLTRRMTKIDSLQHDFISSGAWPNQTAPALLLALTYLLRAQPAFWSQESCWRRAVPSSLAGWERPDGDPHLPPVSSPCGSHTKSCTCGSQAFLFPLDTRLLPFAYFVHTHIRAHTHTHTHPSSLSSDVEFVSVWVLASHRLLPTQQYWCLSVSPPPFCSFMLLML